MKKCDCFLSNGLMKSKCFDGGCDCDCHKTMDTTARKTAVGQHIEEKSINEFRQKFPNLLQFLRKEYSFRNADRWLEEFIRETIQSILLQSRKEWKEAPMGVLEWRKHGQDFGYWEYFEKEACKELLEEVMETIKICNKDALSEEEREHGNAISDTIKSMLK